jgi:lipoyl(octanoyl) transferase
LTAARRAGAPGVYIDGNKIAALGVRVRKGRCYHGLALNVSMNTDPFLCINPCGYPGLGVTQLREHGSAMTVTQAAEALLPHLLHHLGYNGYNIILSEGLTDLQSVPLAS